MNRYFINIGKAINRLLPFYMRGRNIILYLTAILQPLQSLANSFNQWANEIVVATKMTSQIILFEWYLNRQLSKYFQTPNSKIVIRDSESIGVPIYWEEADIEEEDEVVVGFENENLPENVVFYYDNEILNFSQASFIVYSPQINTELITREKYLQLLKGYIERYRLSGKTYIIKINQ